MPGNNQDLWHQLLQIPHKILQYHHLDGLAQLVLHHLADKRCFNLSKAAYLIDNPDFGCLVGVAGFFQPETQAPQDWWHDPKSNLELTNQSKFNQEVRKIAFNFHKNPHKKSGAIQDLSTQLQFLSPQILQWEMKHKNQGILMFQEGENPLSPKMRNTLTQATAFLSLGGF